MISFCIGLYIDWFVKHWFVFLFSKFTTQNSALPSLKGAFETEPLIRHNFDGNFVICSTRMRDVSEPLLHHWQPAVLRRESNNSSAIGKRNYTPGNSSVAQQFFKKKKTSPNTNLEFQNHCQICTFVPFLHQNVKTKKYEIPTREKTIKDWPNSVSLVLLFWREIGPTLNCWPPVSSDNSTSCSSFDLLLNLTHESDWMILTRKWNLDSDNRTILTTIVKLQHSELDSEENSSQNLTGMCVNNFICCCQFTSRINTPYSSFIRSDPIGGKTTTKMAKILKIHQKNSAKISRFHTTLYLSLSLYLSVYSLFSYIFLSLSLNIFTRVFVWSKIMFWLRTCGILSSGS